MALCPFALWLPVKMPVKERQLEHFRSTPKGFMLHISSSRDNTLQGIQNTFSNKKEDGGNPFPTHFAITTEGSIGQFIDTQYHCWSAEWSVSYFSVECAATNGDSLTYSQLGAAAQLYAWLSEEHKIKVKLATNTSDEGLTYHSMGKTGHPFCPGIAVINQREHIVELTNSAIKNQASPIF